MWHSLCNFPEHIFNSTYIVQTVSNLSLVCSQLMRSHHTHIYMNMFNPSLCFSVQLHASLWYLSTKWDTNWTCNCKECTQFEYLKFGAFEIDLNTSVIFLFQIAKCSILATFHAGNIHICFKNFHSITEHTQHLVCKLGAHEVLKKNYMETVAFWVIILCGLKGGYQWSWR